MSAAPLFRFGVIADVQYADVDDATDFKGEEQRRYRNALKVFEQGVDHWNQEWIDGGKPLDFIAQLGDVLDGKARTHFDKAMDDISGVVKKCKCERWVHLVGNHELYNTLDRKLLAEKLPSEPGFGILGPEGNSYYSFSPAQGWKIFVLDPYLFSVLLPPESPVRGQAQEFLLKMNPNDTTRTDVDWTKDLQPEQEKYVPFNGDLGEEQTQWLLSGLKACKANNERAIVMSHIPMFVGATKPSCTTWTAPDLLEQMELAAGPSLAAVFCGHDHAGGFATKDGVHHITFPSPMLCAGDAVAYGVAEVFPDRIELRGQGDVASRTLPFA
eukprot:NODE_871_length_1142_cov_97.480788_g829_i0.p1 GENE.NODE_871_length_1142_cov_97.480788_g829_i0~~NODE_871_length_1142_cov_97.480788_g829_i0.p1  ORF type:complete len:327 (+),score=53.11 NODE_871_length_1142_cov_97.480788_g829_i0:120-1100(+)